jgi:hypothetical protein
MANITLPAITTTARQDQALAFLLTRTNQERAAQSPPLTALADVSALLVYILQGALRDYVAQHQGERKNVIAAAVDNATNAQLSAAATALGVALP